MNIEAATCCFLWWEPAWPLLHLSSSMQLHNAANANQKEKYEADLKKEIKKLQVSAERWEAIPPPFLPGLITMIIEIHYGMKYKTFTKSPCDISC